MCFLFVFIHTCRWKELNSLAQQRGRLLSGAEQVHKFVRDATETNDRVDEKVWEKYYIYLYHGVFIHSHTVSKPNVDASVNYY